MRGRPKTPVEVARRRGNPGKRALPQPVLLGGRALEPWEAPSILCEDGREFWDGIVEGCHGIGLLDELDRYALEGAAAAWGQYRKASRVLAAQGLAGEGSMGQIVEHPMASTMRNALSLALRFLEQFGLTPSARSRLGMTEMKRRSLAEELGRIFGGDPDDPDDPEPAIDGEAEEIAEAVQVCGECGSARGRRHAESCSRRRKPKVG